MTRKYSDYNASSNAELTLLTGKNLPEGDAWNAKADVDSNMYKLLSALSEMIRALEDRIQRLANQWDVRVTTDLIVEWETAVGIPDECRDRAGDIETRRQDVLDKLRKIPIITVADYQALAESITGEPAANWNIRPGSQDFPDDPVYRFVLLVGSPNVTSGKFVYPFGNNAQLSVTSLTSVGTTATATVSSTADMVDGSNVEMSGAVETEYNGFFDITITSGTTFDYTFAGSGTSPATGTILVNFGADLPSPLLDASGNDVFINNGILFEGYPFAGDFRTDVLKCVFRKVAPGNVALVFD
ncbi:DUF2313 domain-containing protein [Candidatus Pacearchaeota archaeon]|nr:DUF2313 domain-containing protein [Candidatus Pacearchaeota archaeon]